ncbi:FAD-dependent monooxygenase [Streptomyces sp. DSM 44917]|uniref:FAD-dependent monooxygenase n=1 Tax=Streptomyces boetiae TaxID=3075541 RepID=A0ABU2LCK7_9ACTN|nr:FAD-dependent monooxygenase [Streptomyces sp. DSM 44917]MDT0309309.1 FAD-dependent monooxygenase [Streptomyces sp. DSM 44917]
MSRAEHRPLAAAPRRLRTRVGIIGAGPAGLVLANVLTRAGVDCLVVERASRAHVLARARAGLLEDRTVRALRRHGLAGGVLAEGVRHGWCEFRCLGRAVRVDYAAHAGGRAHWVYPQQRLVGDLLTALPPGAEPLFGEAVRAIEGFGQGAGESSGKGPGAGRGGALLLCESGLEIACDWVAGCDGYRGAARTALAALPAGAHLERRRRHAYDWLTVLAETDRPAEGVVYAVHPEGFAGMMPRTPSLVRFYLQCAPGETAAHWPAERIARQLTARLGDLPLLKDFPEVRVLRMRSSRIEPLRLGRLMLAGDAAHLLTPSGAKGANLAIADALALADALLTGRPGAYGARRLPRIRRAAAFSERLLGLLHLPPGEAGPAALRGRLHAFERLAGPGPEAAAFAHEYAGRPDADDRPR